MQDDREFLPLVELKQVFIDEFSGINYNSSTEISRLMINLDLAFQAAVKKNKSAEISETILYAIVDDLCENETHWQTYGLREIEGKKRFAGPGLKAETTFGLNIEGGLWSKKMTAFCWRLLGDKDEHELLETFREGELKQLLCHEGELIYCKSRKISDEL